MKRLYDFRELAPAQAILLAFLGAAGMLWGNDIIRIFGALLAVIVTVLTVRSLWPGILVIFPLVASIQPTPVAIGVQEGVFALSAVVVFFKSIFDASNYPEWTSPIKRPGVVLCLAVGLALVNIAAAVSHGVALVDWVRGLAPFIFLGLFFPVFLAVKRQPERLAWLGLAIGGMITLLALRVMVPYVTENMDVPYWLIVEDGALRRIPETLVTGYPGAQGPYLDRVTMSVQSATDAALPVGMVAGLIIATFAGSVRIVVSAFVVSVISLIAILMTYTRSMLLSALVAMVVFSIEAIRARWNSKRMVALTVGLLLIGAASVIFLGLGTQWGHRMGAMAESENREPTVTSVSTRIEEYTIAWDRFIAHPIFGNGLGNKHNIRFLGPRGWQEQQVGYIHNWPLYFLMATGILGFLAYAKVLLTPIYRQIVIDSRVLPALVVVRYITLTMAIYGLFFAVFRLITFNLLLATAWGIILAYPQTAQRSDSTK